jgi:hypothetical protein
MKPGDPGAVGFAIRTLLERFHEVQSPRTFNPVNPGGLPRPEPGLAVVPVAPICLGPASMKSPSRMILLLWADLQGVKVAVLRL